MTPLKNERPNFEKLLIWQEGMDLTVSMYLLTKKFPKEELFGLTSQLRRASSSVPLNIAEGSGRGKKEFVHFLTIALTSCNEVITILHLARRLEYSTEQDAVTLQDSYLILIRKIQSLRQRVKSEITTK
jgi:four helix bundle protein